jgi:hypothetical protein
MNRCSALYIVSRRPVSVTLEQDLVNWFNQYMGMRITYIKLIYGNYIITDSRNRIVVEISNGVTITHNGVILIHFNSLHQLLGQPEEVLVICGLIDGKCKILVDKLGELPNEEFWSNAVIPKKSLCLLNTITTPSEIIKVYQLSKPTESYICYNFVEPAQVLGQHIQHTQVAEAINSIRTCVICYSIPGKLESICDEQHHFCTECCPRFQFCPLCRQAVV